MARLKRSIIIKLIAPLLGWGMAILTHALHNTLASFLSGMTGLAVGTFFDWTGWFFMFLFIIWALYQEQNYLKKHLWEEVTTGVISKEHYRTATSAWLQSFARTAALFHGRFGYTARFYKLCGELAHKKQHLATLGNERGNAAAIQRLRDELRQLAPYAQD